MCDYIHEVDVADNGIMTYIRVNRHADMFITDRTRLEVNELQKYLNGKTGYGWHISDLVIYDKPKALSEFAKPCNYNCFAPCPYYRGKEYNCEKPVITSPPQSWYYVEEVKKNVPKRKLPISKKTASLR